MTRADLLNAIVDDGQTEIPLAYPRPDQADKREGAIASFEACRGLDDAALLALLSKARADREAASSGTSRRYWWTRMFELQVEWTLGVLSAAAEASDLPRPTGFTVRHRMKAADVLGASA